MVAGVGHVVEIRAGYNPVQVASSVGIKGRKLDARGPLGYFG
jgi:hypothetical protein